MVPQMTKIPSRWIKLVIHVVCHTLHLYDSLSNSEIFISLRRINGNSISKKETYIKEAEEQGLFPYSAFADKVQKK